MQLPVKYDLRDKRRKTFLRYLRSKFPTPSDLASTIRRFPMLRVEHFESLHRLHKNMMVEICHELLLQGTPVDLSLVFKKASREAFKLRSGKDHSDHPEA